MAYCGPRGIPKSIFLGREWPTAGEPMWTEDDTDVALAWLRDQRERCPRCGSTPGDWPVDEKGRLLPDPPLDAYVHTCIGCDVVAGRYEEMGKSRNPGDYVVLAPHRDEEDRGAGRRME